MKFKKIIKNLFDDKVKNTLGNPDNIEDKIVRTVLKPKNIIAISIGVFFLIVIGLITNIGPGSVYTEKSEMSTRYNDDTTNAYEKEIIESIVEQSLNENMDNDENENQDIYYNALADAYRQYIGEQQNTSWWQGLVSWFRDLFSGADTLTSIETYNTQIDTSLITSTLFNSRYFINSIREDKLDPFYGTKENGTVYYDIHSASFRDNVEKNYLEIAANNPENTTKIAIDGIQILAKYMIKKNVTIDTPTLNEAFATDTEDTTRHVKYNVRYESLGECREYLDTSNVKYIVNSAGDIKREGFYAWNTNVSAECIKTYPTINDTYDKWNITSVTYERDCEGFKNYLLAFNPEGTDTYPNKKDIDTFCFDNNGDGVGDCYQNKFIESYYHNYVDKSENMKQYDIEKIVYSIYNMLDSYNNSTGTYNVCTPPPTTFEGDLSCGAGGTCEYNNATVKITDKLNRDIAEVSFRDYIIGVVGAEVRGQVTQLLNDPQLEEMIKVKMLAAINYTVYKSSYKHKGTLPNLIMYPSTGDQMWCDPREDCYYWDSASQSNLGFSDSLSWGYPKSVVDKYGLTGGRKWYGTLSEELITKLGEIYDSVNGYFIVRSDLMTSSFPTDFSSYLYHVGYTNIDQIAWKNHSQEGKTFVELFDMSYGKNSLTRGIYGTYKDPYTGVTKVWDSWTVRKRDGKYTFDIFTCAGSSATYEIGDGYIPEVYTDEHIEDRKYNCLKGYICYKQLNYRDTNEVIYRATGNAPGRVSEKGCMPTSLSIIASGFKLNSKNGQIYTPVTLINEVFYENNICTINSSSGCSNYNVAKKVIESLGLTASEKYLTSSDKQELISHLKNGYPVLVHAVGGGYYTGGGHYMTLLGINDQGQVFLSDPGRSGGTASDGRHEVNTWVEIDTLIKGQVDWFMTVSP